MSNLTPKGGDAGVGVAVWSWNMLGEGACNLAGIHAEMAGNMKHFVTQFLKDAKRQPTPDHPILAFAFQEQVFVKRALAVNTPTTTTDEETHLMYEPLHFLHQVMVDNGWNLAPFHNDSGEEIVTGAVHDGNPNSYVQFAEDNEQLARLFDGNSVVGRHAHLKLEPVIVNGKSMSRTMNDTHKLGNTVYYKYDNSVVKEIVATPDVIVYGTDQLKEHFVKDDDVLAECLPNRAAYIVKLHTTFHNPEKSPVEFSVMSTHFSGGKYDDQTCFAQNDQSFLRNFDVGNHQLEYFTAMANNAKGHGNLIFMGDTNKRRVETLEESPHYLDTPLANTIAFYGSDLLKEMVKKGISAQSHCALEQQINEVRQIQKEVKEKPSFGTLQSRLAEYNSSTSGSLQRKISLSNKLQTLWHFPRFSEEDGLFPQLRAGPPPASTDNSSVKGSVIDHIFYYGDKLNLQPHSYKVLCDDDIMKRREKPTATGDKFDILVTDHFPVTATFRVWGAGQR